MGWLLRATARFWNHDVLVQDVRMTLKESLRDAKAL